MSASPSGDKKKIVLTPRQKEWLTRHFKHTKNEELAARLGISQSTLHRFARALGLKKTRQFVHKCQAATAAAAKRSHLMHGTFPPKGFRIPRSEEYQFKPGHTETKATKRKRVAKATETRRKTWKEERARAHWGFKQRTKLRVIRQPDDAIKQRYYLRKRGYIVARGSMSVYYDENTLRSPKMEARKMGDKHFIAFKYLPKESALQSDGL